MRAGGDSVPGSADEAGAAAAEYRPPLLSMPTDDRIGGRRRGLSCRTFLGLTRARQAGTTIADPKAYLTTAVTRLGINYLSSARVRRETYVGTGCPSWSSPAYEPTGRAG
jgi:RNA polymerase sigma-70 factor (ECF subfamily)